MKILRKDLLGKLRLIREPLFFNAADDDYTSFIFLEDKILSYNGEVCMYCSTENNFTFSISASKFVRVLESISDDELDIQVQNSKVYISSKSAKLEILCTSTPFAKDICDEEITWKTLPGNFYNGLICCSFTVSEDITHEDLNCILVRGQDILSSDNMRITWYLMDDKIEDTFLLTSSYINVLKKWRVSSYFVSEKWVYFLCDAGQIIAFRKVSYLPDKLDRAKEFFTSLDSSSPLSIMSDINKVLDLTGIFLEGEELFDRFIKVSVKGKDAIFEVMGSDGKANVKVLDCFSNELDTFFYVNPVFLSQVLKYSNMMSIYEDRIVFYREDKFKHLMVISRNEA